jgi:uncharacterized membrane protein
MELFANWQSLLATFFRFGHIAFGIIWIGHLAFLNLVNVPLQGDLDGETKLKVNPKLLLRVFWWFRMSAMYTFVFGWLLFGYKYLDPHMGRIFFESEGGVSNRGWWILFGGLTATIMWFNVWFVIWPRQKQILGALAAGKPHPDAAKLAATAFKASRFNLFASGPMLWAMITPNNDSGRSPLFMLVAVVLGIGFWQGLVKRSKKIKTTGE